MRLHTLRRAEKVEDWRGSSFLSKNPVFHIGIDVVQPYVS